MAQIVGSFRESGNRSRAKSVRTHGISEKFNKDRNLVLVFCQNLDEL